ncbi:unnamed protein product [Caenorhabditis auriculariae]|uniref:Major facilitator superfamily (MFS) profile domain-containing protein n=1 Tax=Caenorhabditis auriculariae TaxID=2777116 RepID=A0A8S1GYN9_9PELO|nr:unnamed protein product [Caenorhabditis auriculariae]
MANVPVDNEAKTEDYRKHFLELATSVELTGPDIVPQAPLYRFFGLVNIYSEKDRIVLGEAVKRTTLFCNAMRSFLVDPRWSELPGNVPLKRLRRSERIKAQNSSAPPNTKKPETGKPTSRKANKRMSSSPEENQWDSFQTELFSTLGNRDSPDPPHIRFLQFCKLLILTIEDNKRRLMDIWGLDPVTPNVTPAKHNLKPVLKATHEPQPLGQSIRSSSLSQMLPAAPKNEAHRSVAAVSANFSKPRPNRLRSVLLVDWYSCEKSSSVSGSKPNCVTGVPLAAMALPPHNRVEVITYDRSVMTTSKDDRKDDELVEQQLEEAGFIKPPDGGYGWLVVFASFLANLIVDGIIFTVGDILLPQWMADYNASATSAALIISILSGTYLLVGPIASVLANLYGCRAVVIGGAILSCIGFVASAVTPQIYYLYITFGLIGGLGFGFIYLPAIVIIAQYFSEKRSMATGMAVCGSGIGTTIFSMLNPFVMYLVGNNWRIFSIFIALVTLLCIISAIIYRPIEATADQIEKVAQIVEEYEQSHPHDKEATKLGSHHPSLDASHPFLSTVELNTAAMKGNVKMLSHKNLVDAVAKESIRDLNRPLSKMDVFYSGSTQNLRERTRTNSVSMGHRKTNSITEDELEIKQSNIYLSRAGLAIDSNGTPSPKTWKSNLTETLGALLDTSLLYSPSFLVLAFSGLLTLSCFYVPYNYIGNHIDKLPDATPAKKALIISLLGIINIFARIGCGWIADRPQVDALFVSNVAIIGAGLATAAVPFYSAYWHFVAFCLPFACGVACFAALRSVICLDLFGLEKLSNAFGILLTFMGVGAIVGSPLAALLKDVTGNFDVSFYIMGALMATSGVICLPLRKLREWEVKRGTEKDANLAVELQSLKP